MSTVKKYLSLIKFSHTIFAMPFAMIGFFLGAFDGVEVIYGTGQWNLNKTIGWESDNKYLGRWRLATEDNDAFYESIHAQLLLAASNNGWIDRGSSLCPSASNPGLKRCRTSRCVFDDSDVSGRFSVHTPQTRPMRRAFSPAPTADAP